MIYYIVAAALAAAVWALASHARAYAARVEARWPALGRFIDVEGMRVHVREGGAAGAPPLLFIHGASANHLELWSALAAELSDAFQLIAYDRPGMGYSARARRGAHTLAAQARVARAVLELADGPTIVVAHSLGASVALRLALDHPGKVAGLVLIAPASHPFPGPPAWWARLAASPITGPAFCGLFVPWLGPLMSRAAVANNFWPAQTPKNYFEDAGVGLIFRPRAFRASAQDVNAANREFGLQAARYPELFIPSIIITAEKDRVVSPKRHARALAADLPAAELVIAPDAGHMPHRLRNDLVLGAIRRMQAMASISADS